VTASRMIHADAGSAHQCRVIIGLMSERVIVIMHADTCPWLD